VFRSKKKPASAGRARSVIAAAARKACFESLEQRRLLAAGVESMSFHYKTAPHKIIYDFDQNVQSSLSAADLHAENLNTSETVAANLSYGTGDVAEFAVSNFANGVLSKGNYQATIFSDAVSGTDGQPMASDANFEFFFMPADANHDRKVDLVDYNYWAPNNGYSGRDFSQGDFNYDGSGEPSGLQHPRHALRLDAGGDARSRDAGRVAGQQPDRAPVELA
jgi:hypothetical protein